MKALRMSFVFLILCCACEKSSNMPVELTTAFEYLDDTMSAEAITELQLKDDKGFPPYFYELEIQDKLQTQLTKNDRKWQIVNTYFDSLGIEKTKDRSGLILNMYQNYLNEIDININDEIKIVEAYRSPILSCDSIMQRQALEYLNHFKVKDIINIKMPVDEHENAVDYSCPDSDWTFIEGHDLQIQVVINDKVVNDAIEDCYFKVEILQMSNSFITIQSREINQGDTVHIPTVTSWKLYSKS